MNLFRSEEHVRRWPLHFQAADDYVMSIADWASVFGASMFRNRLDDDYLAQSHRYLEDYHRALLAKGKALPSPDRVLMTVMFVDIVDSTGQASRLGDQAWRRLLERYNEETVTHIEHFGGTAVKQTGDGFMSRFDGPTRAVFSGAAIRDAVRDLGLEVRIGIHSGECEVLGNDLAGIAVHIAARVAATAGPGIVMVTESVVAATTGSGIEFVDHGSHTLKGVPDTWRLHTASV